LVPVPHVLTLETLENKIKELEKMMLQPGFPVFNGSGILETQEMRT
jgi:hypothetical protein